MPFKFRIIAASVLLAAVLHAQNSSVSFMAGGSAFVPETPDLLPVGPFTIETWFFPAELNFSGDIVAKLDDSSTYPAYGLLMMGGSPRLYVRTGVVLSEITSPNAIPMNQWSHIAGTYDGVNTVLYVNGAVVATGTATGGVVASTGIFGINEPDSIPSTCSLDELRLWSVARTQADIQREMRYERDDHPDLIAAWHFNGNLLDSYGGHNATGTGTISFPNSTSPIVVPVVAPARSGIGSAITYVISAVELNSPYLFDVSLAGTSPGVALPSPVYGAFRLNPLFLNLDHVAPPSLLTGFLGFIDVTGHAQAMLSVPNLPVLIGVRFYASVLILDPASPIGIARTGNAVSTEITDHSPIITSISSTQGPISGGLSVAITGNYFRPGAVVRFNQNIAGSNVVVSPTMLTCTTPPGILGPAAITVTNTDTTASTATGLFSYVPILAVSSINPSPALPGQSVTINGSGFLPGITVTIAGQPITPTSTTASQVVFVAPATACNAPMIIQNPPPVSSMALRTFNPAPIITGVVNPQGPAAGGSLFTIAGASFSNGMTVTLDGVPVTIMASTPTSRVCVAPPHAVGQVPITVTTITGCSFTAAQLFTYF